VKHDILLAPSLWIGLVVKFLYSITGVGKEEWPWCSKWVGPGFLPYSWNIYFISNILFL